jgi:hypothetical protein
LLAPHTRQFWSTRFPALAAEAVTPVTNLVDRLRASPNVAGLLGQPRSTYNIRQAMDNANIVLWSTAGSGAWATLVTCFITRDLLRSALSRVDTPPHLRRPFHGFVDEVQKIAGTGSGSAGVSIAESLEQARKFGLRLDLMSQRPDRLAKPTLEAIMTNRSVLMSHNVDADSAALIAKHLAGQVDARHIATLPKYQFIAQVTHEDQRTVPIHVRGFNPDELWASVRRTDNAAAFTAVADRNLRRRPLTEVLRDLGTHDDAILDWVKGHRHATPRPCEQPPRETGVRLSLPDTEAIPADGRDGFATVTPIRSPR